ncbi:MAG TPA: TetR/AcrR family transcriptional regulator [Aliidongia sp.]|nr:TetR/AcrR family transcriptional regulator [Aliidongia sp.]
MAVSLASRSAPVPQRKARMSDEDRRSQLIGAAETVFLERGFHAATMDDIARQAGMSKKTVYQVFPAKAALFEALLMDRCSIFTVTIADDARPPRAVLTDVLCRSVAHALTERQIAILRLMIAESPRSPEITAALERLGVGRGKGALEKWLATKTEEGTLAVDDPQEAATLLFWTAAGDFVMQALLNKGPITTPAAIEKRVDHVVAAFFRGMEAGSAG